MVSEMVKGGERAVMRCIALGKPPYSDSALGLTRTYLSPAWLASLEQLSVWMMDAGMRVRRDEAGNLIGRYEGVKENLPALMIGSHIDSVPMAGHFDGPLGIMLGIEAVALLSADNQRLPFAIEIIAFGDEEGSRFSDAMLTSRAVGGAALPDLQSIMGRDGVSLSDALRQNGLDASKFANAARQADQLIAYLEAHIEQGPQLEAQGLPLGIVSGIAAQLRMQIDVIGIAGHAGTTPMTLRHDAVTGAAEMILMIETYANAHSDNLVATVGRIEVTPGASNVIANRLSFTIDIRSLDLNMRDSAAQNINKNMQQIAERRELSLETKTLFDLKPSPSDPMLTQILRDAVEATGQQPYMLASGAGHDAIHMASLCPMTMLFIRCAGGISHNPAESVEISDVDAALKAILTFINLLKGKYCE